MAVDTSTTLEIFQENETLRLSLRIHGIQCPVFLAIFNRIELKDLPIFVENLVSLKSFAIDGGGNIDIHWGGENDYWNGFAKYSFPRFEPSFRPLGEIFQILKLVLETVLSVDDKGNAKSEAEPFNLMDELRRILSEVQARVRLFQDHVSVERIEKEIWELRIPNALKFAGIKYQFADSWLPTVDPQLFDLELSSFCIELLKAGYIIACNNPRIKIIEYLKMGRIWGAKLPEAETSILNSNFSSLQKVAKSYNFLVSLAESRGSLPQALNKLPFGIDWSLKMQPSLPGGLDLWALSQKCYEIWIAMPSADPGKRLEVIDNWEFEFYVDYIDDRRLGYVGIAFWEELSIDVQ